MFLDIYLEKKREEEKKKKISSITETSDVITS
jgi:hypothetical protein